MVTRCRISMNFGSSATINDTLPPLLPEAWDSSPGGSWSSSCKIPPPSPADRSHTPEGKGRRRPQDPTACSPPAEGLSEVW